MTSGGIPHAVLDPPSPDDVRYEASDTFGEPGRYVHLPTGALVQWVNAHNQEAVHAPSGHFEVFGGPEADYVPVRAETLP